MITFDDKTTEALEYVRKAEKIMAELGHTKYSLSGMCSAAMRHDLEKEVCELLGELAEARKQRDTLAEALQRYMRASEKVGHSPVAYPDEWLALRLAATEAETALAAVKGGES
jgi:hypothetical protein